VLTVSVAMATFNGSRHLPAQLDSILSQVRRPDELVVSDDGSTDDTIAMLESFARSAPFPVQVISGNRLGYKGNFFRAIQACHGDLIALTDQDDVWSPGKLSIPLTEFDRTRRVAVVGHTATVTTERLVPIGARFPLVTKRVVHRAGRFPVWGTHPGFALLFRRELVDIANPADRPESVDPPVHGDPLMAHDDWVVFVGGALGDVVQLPHQLVSYRRHNENTGGAFGEKTWSAQVQQSLAFKGGKELYRRRARLARERASYLEQLIDRVEDKATLRALHRSTSAYARAAKALERRASLSEAPNRTSDVLRIGAHTARGDYRNPRYGGLGLPSLAKDVIASAGSPGWAAKLTMRLGRSLDKRRDQLRR
jgi:glycosyltransferase involved in cell wall biosynthesis